MRAFVLWIFLTAAAEAGTPSLALIQYNADSHYGDSATNLENLTRLAESAVANGATALVFPEGSTHGYATSERLWCRPGLDSFSGRACDDVTQVAESVRDGATVRYWTDFAKQHDVVVIFSIIEVDKTRHYNSVVVVNSAGIMGRYRKRFLYWVDNAYASPGADLLTINLYGRRYGFMICMDANYSELFEKYRALGIGDLIMVMDWDQSPESSRAGKKFFPKVAKSHSMNLFVSDQSSWDSTGFYPAGGANRQRAPLSEPAVGSDGYVLIPFAP